MHIPAYAYATIRAAIPPFPTSRQVGAVDCCLCDRPFEDLAAIPLGPTPESGLFGCRPCLTRLVTRARRARDASLLENAEQARAESAHWEPVRERYLARLDSVREAAEAVAELVKDEKTEPLRAAWLLVSLESAYNWVPDAPEPPASAGREDRELRDGAFRLDLAMISVREAVAERLAYHLINEAQPDEPEMCEEFECPEDCSGRHDSSDVDCGPDAVFEDLAEHGVVVEPPEPEPFPGELLRRFMKTDPEEEQEEDPERAELEKGPATVLAHFGVDANDTDVLVSAAAVGLVADAWRDGPLDEIHATDGGPSDGEIFAQSVDLYRRAREALVAAREDGPEALAAFVAVASDTRLRWAGGSRFMLRALSRTQTEAVEGFVRHLDNRVRFTTEAMRARSWRAALLYRAASAAVKTPGHFGMPAWPAVVAAAMARLGKLDRTGAPEVLNDLTAVENALLEAPDRLGAAALDWLVEHAVFKVSLSVEPGAGFRVTPEDAP
ncbi:hypothetical protein GCM10010497_29480 [Streptomyces cinereoruber]|uniref:Uncharacterized protein n=1 Tax=Streptomyces cinereoruber TaxID=67260 RepID=A0AAV4KHA3_9ACTN|nr:hypothetical protein [Streptomyces cinereoruber]MBB4155958.1 hypothetical protein [Streptomyces cinereoruber]MBY8816923.1 hypothetical protein [Streptomyces cinereoruber]NIH64769.1 hypothetical protein [Streptomyces cinereoruber]QEV32453.1 hypothetical protein CP977_09930 [Streptomyces cinereoruber]GGR25480.1 hypothetical protein GCM10010497_29480 [Streptomyces cinereoruber]